MLFKLDDTTNQRMATGHRGPSKFETKKINILILCMSEALHNQEWAGDLFASYNKTHFFKFLIFELNFDFEIFPRWNKPFNIIHRVVQKDFRNLNLKNSKTRVGICTKLE